MEANTKTITDKRLENQSITKGKDVFIVNGEIYEENDDIPELNKCFIDLKHEPVITKAVLKDLEMFN